jgi:pimeloyl-ACP methyl ester carboxylesterase
MREFYVDVRGLSLCQCAWGPADGPVVLLLHGMLDHGAMWADVAQRLAEKGCRVLAPDQRGHGRSQHDGPGGSYHLLEFVADLDALLGHDNGNNPLQVNGSVTVVGHSMGAAVAALYASARPQKVNALVLVESILPTDTAETETTSQLTAYLDQLANSPQHACLPDVRAAAGRLRQVIPSLSEEQALYTARRITQPWDSGSGVCWRWDPHLLTRSGVTFNGLAFKASCYTELLRRIQVPVTLVYGEEGSYKTLSQMQAIMPKATAAVLPGGHNLHVEAPESLANIILQNVPIQVEKLLAIRV